VISPHFSSIPVRQGLFPADGFEVDLLHIVNHRRRRLALAVPYFFESLDHLSQHFYLTSKKTNLTDSVAVADGVFAVAPVIGRSVVAVEVPEAVAHSGIDLAAAGAVVGRPAVDRAAD
jgi:hypothetical protein